MTERNPALWMQNRTDHTAEQERALIHGLYLGKEGVMGQDDLKVVQRAAGANMSVDVGPGRATVVGDDNAAQGSYAVWNDAAKNVTLAAAHATNGRKDIIVARIKDAFYSGVSNTFTLEVITGTPAGAADGSGASDPAIPNNCLPLARVTVVATATSIANAKITDLRNRVGTMAACDIVCTSATRPANPFVGMNIYEADTFRHLVYQSATTGWTQPWNMPWGFVAAPALANTNTSNATPSHIDIPGMSIAWTAIAGRRYRVRAQGHVVTSTPNTYGSFALTNAAGLQMAPWGRSDTLIINAGSQWPWFVESIITPAAGAQTAKVMLASTVGGTITVWNNVGYSYITVEDVGPAANPS